VHREGTDKYSVNNCYFLVNGRFDYNLKKYFLDYYRFIDDANQKAKEKIKDAV
jgi:hypothetical protein